jgi:para-aminobenzoate synthetase component 1
MKTDISTIFQHIPPIDDLYSEIIAIKEPFMTMASRFVSDPGTVLLMSGGELDASRYHILGIKPWLTFSGRHRDIRLTIDGSDYPLTSDPFTVLQALLNHFHLNETIINDLAEFQFPIYSGLLGYLSYDLKDFIETLPRTSVDTLQLPHILLYAPSMIIVYDKQTKTTRLYIPKRSGNHHHHFKNILSEFKNSLLQPPPSGSDYFGIAGGFQSNFQKSDYLRSIESIIDYIKAGDVYQVNMSQRFEMDFYGDAFTLFKKLYQQNPAPFFAFINAGNHHILSTSPERFLVQTGNRVETRPIKGTRPRGSSSSEDKKLQTELMNSSKDDAELSMIVDLLRNDIGKVCKPGSVKVIEHKRLEPYQNVYHLVSIVEGVLDDNCDTVDLIKATFPGGSITGCPKIRAMEIIDELEPHRRHIYTGSIGYISFHDTMDLSIVIRTATIYADKIYFSVGGGVVYDSDPEDEYNETLHKGKTLMTVFAGKSKPLIQHPNCWINGVLKPLKQASVPVSDEGFQYGFGIFETIRVSNGVPLLLEQHLKRFYRSWQVLLPDEIPDLSWDEIIRQVISANQLDNQVAAVKILATRGSGTTPARNRTLLVMARPYTHRLKEKEPFGLNLITYPDPRQTPLADHKTANYLYYLRAGRWAAEHGGDEALILNPDGTISETNTGNILIVKGQTIILSQSPHVLPGVMQEAVLSILSDWGFQPKYMNVKRDCLYEGKQVIVTNSLMGAVPVLSIDGNDLPKPTDLCEKINRSVLENRKRKQTKKTDLCG